MTTTPEPRLVSSYNTAVGHRADPYRNETRTRLKIDCRVRQKLIGEALVERGVQLVDVPTSMVSTIEAMVIDRAKYAMAEERYKRALASGEQKHGDRIKHPPSIEASHREMFGEDMKPLWSVDVVEIDLPAPLTAEEKRAAAVAATVAGQRRRGRPPKQPEG